MFLVLFAGRSIAGAVLCELYGQHEAPPAAAHLVEAPAYGTHDHPGAPEQQAPERGDHVCEEPVYLAGEPVSLSSLEYALGVATIPWSFAAACERASAVTAFGVSWRLLAHPPPPRLAADISSRLRSRLRI